MLGEQIQLEVPVDNIPISKMLPRTYSSSEAPVEELQIVLQATLIVKPARRLELFSVGEDLRIPCNRPVRPQLMGTQNTRRETLDSPMATYDFRSSRNHVVLLITRDDMVSTACAARNTSHTQMMSCVALCDIPAVTTVREIVLRAIAGTHLMEPQVATGRALQYTPKPQGDCPDQQTWGLFACRINICAKYSGRYGSLTPVAPDHCIQLSLSSPLRFRIASRSHG